MKNGNWEMWINTLSRTGMIVTSGNHLNGGSWDQLILRPILVAINHYRLTGYVIFAVKLTELPYPENEISNPDVP